MERRRRSAFDFVVIRSSGARVAPPRRISDDDEWGWLAYFRPGDAASEVAAAREKLEAAQPGTAGGSPGDPASTGPSVERNR